MKEPIPPRGTIKKEGTVIEVILVMVLCIFAMFTMAYLISNI